MIVTFNKKVGLLSKKTERKPNHQFLMRTSAPKVAKAFSIKLQLSWVSTK